MGQDGQSAEDRECEAESRQKSPVASDSSAEVEKRRTGRHADSLGPRPAIRTWTHSRHSTGLIPRSRPSSQLDAVEGAGVEEGEVDPALDEEAAAAVDVPESPVADFALLASDDPVVPFLDFVERLSVA